MNIIKIAVKRRITVMMLFVCIVMLGLVSFGRLGMDLMPDMEIPVAMVMTTYSGAGSEEVESMITDTIETAVASVEGVQDIYSRGFGNGRPGGWKPWIWEMCSTER